MFKRNSLLLLPLLFFYTTITNSKTEFTSKKVDENTQKINLNINVNDGDFIYKDYIDISVDHPDIVLSDWHSDDASTKHFSKEFKAIKKIFDKDFSVAFSATKKTNAEIKDAHIHLSYYLNSAKGIVEETIPLKLPDDIHFGIEEIPTNIDISVQTEKEEERSGKKTPKDKKQKRSITEYLQDLVEKADSIWIKIILAFLLGILLSLTPCIYPMVPITVGILQAQGSKSVWSNFFLSFTYVTGMSTTFAILGLIAAFTGQIFGTLLSNPIFVVILVSFLIYMALSLFGFYEIYIPKSLQPKGGGAPTKGSLLSIFLFGIISGSVASPCVSPGLVLLLSIVATLASKVLGFLLLFAFGLGLGAPLILIGTFSGSMNMLPKAGAWMIEIKKLFGLLLFGVVFYFLNNILPFNILLWILSAFLLVVGIYYFFSVKTTDSRAWKLFKNIVGIICCALSIFVAFNAYKQTYLTKPAPEITFWEKDFDTAMAKAKKENKKLFLDFWSEVCTICKAINKKVFSDQKVVSALQENFVSVKIDGTDQNEEPFASLHKKHKIFGFPTFLLIDPQTGEVIKRWSSEFYNKSNEEIVELLKQS